jgi:hypothetical protein
MVENNGSTLQTFMATCLERNHDPFSDRGKTIRVGQARP